MPYVESILCRDLELRFIDARNITSEARMALGIEGYPSKDQTPILLDEAIRIFLAKSNKEQHRLRQLRWELEAIKTVASSQSGSDLNDSTDRQSSTPSSEQIMCNNRRGVLGFLL